MKRKQWLALVLVLVLMLGGCTAKSDSAPGTANGTGNMDVMYNESFGAVDYESDAPNDAAQAQGRKLILTASLNLETTEFDDAAALLEQRTGEFGGWIENSELQGSSRNNSARYGWYTLRIPAARLEEFLSGAGELGNVLSLNRRQEEITEAYYDTEARLTALKTQEERLLAIMEKAETLDDIIRLESALSDVRYQIESLSGTMRRYDNLVEMATLEVSLREVSSTTPVSGTPRSLGERIGQQFSESLRSLGRFCEGVLVFLIGNLPVLLVIAVIAAAGVFAGRKVWRKKKGQSEEE